MNASEVILSVLNVCSIPNMLWGCFSLHSSSVSPCFRLVWDSQVLCITKCRAGEVRRQPSIHHCVFAQNEVFVCAHGQQSLGCEVFCVPCSGPLNPALNSRQANKRDGRGGGAGWGLGIGAVTLTKTRYRAEPK